VSVNIYLHQVTLAMPPFRQIFNLTGRVQTVPGNMRIKFEVCRFNRFGDGSI